MLRKIIKNKILSCLLFMAAVCQPAKAELSKVEQWLDDCVRCAEAKEDKKASDVIKPDELGKYDLKTGKRIPDPMPDTVQVDDIEFQMATPTNLAKGKPIEKVKTNATVPVQRIHVGGMDFWIPDETEKIADTKPPVQKDLIDLMEGLEKIQMAQSEPVAADTKENMMAGGKLSSQEKDELEKILKLEPSVAPARSTQKDIEDCLAFFESDSKMQKEEKIQEQAQVEPVQVVQSEPSVAPARSTKKDIEDSLAFFESNSKMKKEEKIQEQPKVDPVQVASIKPKEPETIPTETEKVSEPETLVKASSAVAVCTSTKDQIEELLNDPIMQADQKEQQKKAYVSWVKNLEKNIAGFLTSCMVLGVLGHAVSNIKDKKNSLGKVSTPKSNLPEKQEEPTNQENQPLNPEEKIAFKPVRTTTTADERKILSEHIWGLKAIDEIKRRRAVLTREMAKAKRSGDEQKMAEIQSERQKLSARRKEACLRVTGPEMSKIKEERRLLTKRMTIARRQKDQKVMDQITARRQILKEQVKVMNCYIRIFNYRAHRKDFIKSSTMQLIYSHQREYARAA